MIPSRYALPLLWLLRLSRGRRHAVPCRRTASHA